MSSAARPAAHCRRCAIRFPRQGRFTFALGGSRRYAAGPLKLNYAPRLTVGSLDKSAKQPLPEGPKDPKQWVSSGVPKYKVMQSYRKSMEIVSCLDPSEYQDTTVIDANPGPGVFSRALYNHIAPKNHVLIDPAKKYRLVLEPLVESSGGVVKYLDRNPWLFRSYSDFLDAGIIQIDQKDPNEVNPSLLFVANLMDDNAWKSESLAAHFISFMRKQLFIYAHGRVRTWLWIQAPHWYPLFSPPGHKNRKKVSIMRELICDARVLAYSGKLGSKTARGEAPVFNSLEARDLRTSMFYPSGTAALIELMPYSQKNVAVPTEEIDYLVLKMMTLRDRPLETALRITAPGAEILLDSFGPHEGLTPADLTGEQWLRLGEAFHKWPFKPDVLEDETRYTEEGRASLDETSGYAYTEPETTRGVEDVLEEHQSEDAEYEDVAEIEKDKDEVEIEEDEDEELVRATRLDT